MSQKVQLPVKRVFDFSQVEDGRITTAEFKKVEGGYASYWWVSGLNASGELVLLVELQLSLPNKESNPEGIGLEVYRSHVSPIAEMASRVLDPMTLTPVYEPGFRLGLLTEHLRQHREIRTYSDETDGVVASLAKQYQLASTFGLSTAIEYLADWNKVPVSTIKKRLERARLQGLVRRKRTFPVQKRNN